MKNESLPTELLEPARGPVPLVKILGNFSLRAFGRSVQLCADEGDRLWSLGSGFAQCWSVKTGEELQRINVPELGLLQRFSSGIGLRDTSSARLLSSMREPFYKAPRGYVLEDVAVSTRQVFLRKAWAYFVGSVEAKQNELVKLPQSCKQAVLLSSGEWVVCVLRNSFTRLEFRRVGQRGVSSKLHFKGAFLGVHQLSATTALVSNNRERLRVDLLTGNVLERFEKTSEFCALDALGAHLLEVAPRRARLRALDTGEVWDFEHDEQLIDRCVVGGGGRWFSFVDHRGVIRIFSREKQEEQKLNDAIDPVSSVAWTSDGTCVLAAQGTFVRSWNVAENLVERVWELSEPINTLATRPDGKEFAVLFPGGNLACYELYSDAERWRLLPFAVQQRVEKVTLQYTEDGNHLLLAGTFDQSAVLCFCVDAQQGTLLWKHSCEAGARSTSLLFLRDEGAVLLSASRQVFRVSLTDGSIQQRSSLEGAPQLCAFGDRVDAAGNLWSMWKEFALNEFDEGIDETEVSVLCRWNCVTRKRSFEEQLLTAPERMWQVGSKLFCVNQHSIDAYKVAKKPVLEERNLYQTQWGMGTSFSISHQRQHLAVGLQNGMVAVFAVAEH